MKNINPESECMYDQLTILIQLVDKYNKEGIVLIKLDFIHSTRIEFAITNLQTGLSTYAKYTYCSLGAKMAWVGLEFYTTKSKINYEKSNLLLRRISWTTRTIVFGSSSKMA
jgi:hypothetical protein